MRSKPAALYDTDQKKPSLETPGHVVPTTDDRTPSALKQRWRVWDGLFVVVLLLTAASPAHLTTFAILFVEICGTVSILRPLLAPGILGHTSSGVKSGALAVPYTAGATAAAFLGTPICNLGGSGSLEVAYSSVKGPIAAHIALQSQTTERRERATGGADDIDPGTAGLHSRAGVDPMRWSDDAGSSVVRHRALVEVTRLAPPRGDSNARGFRSRRPVQ